jgi:hypothetical protein
MSRIKEPGDAAKAISEKIIELMELLEAHPFVSFDGFSKPLVMRDLNSLGFYIARYFKGQEKIEIKKGVSDKLLLK